MIKLTDAYNFKFLGSGSLSVEKKSVKRTEQHQPTKKNRKKRRLTPAKIYQT
jgi:hypothetical protein